MSTLRIRLSGGIRQTPMRFNGTAEPYRAGFTRRLIAYRDDDIGIEILHIVPALAVQARIRQFACSQCVQGFRMNTSRRIAAGAGNCPHIGAQSARNTFREHASAGIVGTQKQQFHEAISLSATTGFDTLWTISHRCQAFLVTFEKRGVA